MAAQQDPQWRLGAGPPTPMGSSIEQPHMNAGAHMECQQPMDAAAQVDPESGQQQARRAAPMELQQPQQQKQWLGGWSPTPSPSTLGTPSQVRDGLGREQCMQHGRAGLIRLLGISE